jgi:hypothetical protein
MKPALGVLITGRLTPREIARITEVVADIASDHPKDAMRLVVIGGENTTLQDAMQTIEQTLERRESGLELKRVH